MPSGPEVPDLLNGAWVFVPWTPAAAESPASPPASSITRIQDRSTLMPAVRAALGLAPTVRNWNPVVVRDSSQATPAAPATAIRTPTRAGGGGPPTCPRLALPAMNGATWLVWCGC